MRIQLTTLHKRPPDKLALRQLEEDQGAPFVAVKDRSPDFSSSIFQSPEQGTGRAIHKILVPTNFAPSSCTAVDCAIAMAGQSGATLSILQVIDINSPAARAHFGTAHDLM